MDPQAWITLGSALVGALIGGFASAYGSHRVTRADRIRDTRVEIYRNLLPAVWHQEDGPRIHMGMDVEYEALWRAGITCGKKDRLYAREVLARFKMQREDMDGGIERAIGPERKSDEYYERRHQEQVDKLHEALRAWTIYLEHKM